jgi:hypothetical protein
MQIKTVITPYKEVQKDMQKMIKQSKTISFFTMGSDSPSSMQSSFLYHPDIYHLEMQTLFQ